MRKDFRKEQDFYYKNKAKNMAPDVKPIGSLSIESPSPVMFKEFDKNALEVLADAFGVKVLPQNYVIGPRQMQPTRQGGKVIWHHSALSDADLEEFYREQELRMLKMRTRWAEEERLYGESTRVPELWGEDLWMATIIDGEDTDLPQRSYTIKELRQAVQNWVRDLWEYDDNEFFEEYPEISWDLHELQELYRKMYRFINTTDNLGEDVDLDPWYDSY